MGKVQKSEQNQWVGLDHHVQKCQKPTGKVQRMTNKSNTFGLIIKNLAAGAKYASWIADCVGINRATFNSWSLNRQKPGKRKVALLIDSVPTLRAQLLARHQAELEAFEKGARDLWLFHQTDPGRYTRPDPSHKPIKN